MHKFCPTYFTEKKKSYVPFTASLDFILTRPLIDEEFVEFSHNFKNF